MSALGSCDCGAVKITVPQLPTWVASCNCSICRKLGWLVAYYPATETEITGETATYSRGAKVLDFHRCPTCGCSTHWSPHEGLGSADLPKEVRDLLQNRRGVNARLLDGFDPDQTEIRRFDNKDA